MIKGLSEKEEDIIKSILRKYPYEFYYYGSRVKGDFSKSSDLDILLKAENTDYHEISKLKDEFNNSKIPFVVNISIYSNMDKDFYKIIEPSLVRINL